MKIVKKALAVLCAGALIAALAGCSKLSKPNQKQRVDTSEMKLVFRDDFDTLNTDFWTVDADQVRRGGYWDADQVRVENGNLIITTAYRDGTNGPAWYTGSLTTKGKFYMEKGYVEVRCILPKGSGLWGAFWLSSDSMNEGGEEGTEIDVIEGPYYNDPYTKNAETYKNTAFHTIHAGGYGENHQSKQSSYYQVGADMFETFHTYGVQWDENGYTFYVDGMKTWKTGFCPTAVPEYLWLSVEIAGENNSGDPANPENKYTWSGEIEANEGGRSFTSDFIVDYVKGYTFE